MDDPTRPPPPPRSQQRGRRPAASTATASPSDSASGPAPPRSFDEAISICLSKYATFSGRASRSEYWYWALAVVAASFVAAAIDAILGTDAILAGTGVVGVLLSLAVLLPGLAVGARRLHDTGRSGWWLLLALIPLIGCIVLLVLFATPGQPRPNRYG